MPPLTTFHVPKRSLGEAAVNTLHALLDSPSSTPAAKTALIGHVVVRESCGPPRGA
jgi:DNA-binding LacI/PurR family transcriptional regulator